MRKISYIVTGVSLGLTLLFSLLWILGFGFAGASVGNLVHLLLILAMLISVGFFIGLVLLIVSFVKK